MGEFSLGTIILLYIYDEVIFFSVATSINGVIYTEMISCSIIAFVMTLLETVLPQTKTMS